LEISASMDVFLAIDKDGIIISFNAAAARV
jgi:PAS domain-containing protein